MEKGCGVVLRLRKVEESEVVEKGLGVLCGGGGGRGGELLYSGGEVLMLSMVECWRKDSACPGNLENLGSKLQSTE